LKRCFISLLLLAFLFCRPLPARAAVSYTDDMSDMDQNTIKTYYNLAPVSTVSTYPQGVLNSIWGQNAVTFSNASRPIGWADYRVRGADTVTVGIYTWKGTFVSMVEDDVYVFGIHRADMSYLNSQQLAQALYSRGGGGVYARIGGKLYKMVDVDLYFQFLQAADPPPDLIDYGVNVYAGSGADNLSRLSLPSGGTQTRLANMKFDRTAQYCYEELTYTLPSGTAYVRVEINDFTHIDRYVSDTATRPVPPPTGMRTTLSKVAFSGGALELGEAQPLSSLPGASPGSGGGSAADSCSSSGRRGSSSSAGAASRESSSAATSKFQGEVTSSTGSTGGSGKAGAQSAGDSPAAGEEATAPEPPEPPREELQIFRLEPSRSDGFSSLVLAYIVGVSGLIVVLLLRGRGGEG